MTLNAQGIPRLDVILNVEKFIRENNGEYTRKQLWKHYPKKITYSTLANAK